MITRTADRTLLIFETFAERREPLTLSELARLLEMPISTCSNLIRTLQARGYLYEIGRRKAYYPTSRWLIKATAISSADPVTDRVQPYLHSLRDQVGETVLFGKRLGDRVIYLSLAEGTQSIRYTGQIGDLRALHSTASGKALLASMPLHDRLELVSRLDFSFGIQAKAGTPAQRKKLLADVAAGEERGWWVTDGENVEDVMALAAPVKLGVDMYTVVILGPTTRLRLRLEANAELLVALCKKMSAEF